MRIINYNIKYDGRGKPIGEIVDNIFKNRGIKDMDHFLHPEEADLLPLEDLEGIEDAFHLIELARDNDWTVQVHADTDTDGIMSGAIMTRYLRQILDADCVITTINHGKEHGLSDDDLEQYAADLLIVVDSLDHNADNYATLNQIYGTEIIILDHHAIKEDVPYDDYAVLVSSQRPSYKNKALSGAGVVWKFCKYCDKMLNEDFADDYIDLAACGIVADMMDMTIPENRYIVSEGLIHLRNQALKKITGGFGFDSKAISFSVAPLINASNRMDKNEYALMTFLYDDEETIKENIKVLKKCKTEQNETIDELLPDITKQCEQQLDRKMMTVIIDTDYGISGLIANKLLSIYKRPVLVLKDSGYSYGGSMRAVGMKDFRKICNESGLARAEGHELASGISIDKDDFDKFCSYIEDKLSHLEVSDEEVTDVDVLLTPGDIDDTLVDAIKDIDKISGENFKPITAMIKTDSYEIKQMSNYKHIAVEDWSTKLWIIKWNYTGSFDEMEDSAMLGDTVCAVGNITKGYIGRTFHYQLICESLEVE